MNSPDREEPSLDAEPTPEIFPIGKVSRRMGKARKPAATPLGDALPKVSNRKQRRAVSASLRKYIKGLRK